VLKDRRRIAIKVQYPGISESIDSDVDNVAVMLRMFNLLPKEIEIDTLLAEAKKQLHIEADYRQEADALNRFRQFLGDDDRFTLPEVLDEMTTTEVLTMSYLDGLPIESLTERDDEERNRIAGHMLELGMREIFDWGLVQTDPNFANYRYQPKSGRIELMDFGATRQYSHKQRSAMRALLNACIDGDDTDMLRAATEVGYIGDSDSSGYRDSVMVLLRTATEPARLASDYDFGRSDLAGRMSEVVLDMRLRKRFGQIPPADILFLHRKVGGLYLLLSRLNVKLPVHQYVRGNLISGMQ
jgi:predicted unusual protein kinase regulating ubiquinone biosynthesis (AarF/ABC1/UbiB family)